MRRPISAFPRGGEYEYRVGPTTRSAAIKAGEVPTKEETPTQNE